LQKKVGRGDRELMRRFPLFLRGVFEKCGVQNVVFCMVKRGELHGECGVLAATF
jgi:hypothetical protein